MSSSARDGYSTTSITQHQINHPDLPFTGIDVGLTVVFAVLLTALGLSLRKLVRRV